MPDSRQHCQIASNIARQLAALSEASRISGTCSTTKQKAALPERQHYCQKEAAPLETKNQKLYLTVFSIQEQRDTTQYPRTARVSIIQGQRQCPVSKDKETVLSIQKQSDCIQYPETEKQ